MKKLTTYKKKRKADQTPEPFGRRNKTTDTLIFVVQKHQASHLHYDLRLEVDGVLKSWAVPKGPSMHPEDKRLAIMVEDHPYDYKDFAGVIPKGNYGAGSVTIWDKGTYTVAGATSTKEIERYMRTGLKKGHVDVILKGKRLNGEFVLVRTARPQENAWLLFAKTRSTSENKENPKRENKPSQKMPPEIKPMLAQLIEEPFNKKGWLFEIKWDGYRVLAIVSKNKVHLISRNNNSFNKQFPSIAKELLALKEHELVLDGEVVILDTQGRSQFQLMQNHKSAGAKDLFYYVFDLIYCDGQDIRDWPLLERKERLEVILAPLKNSHIRYSDHILDKGIPFFKEAQKLGLEGIIAKKQESTYQMKRSSDWLKIKTQMRQEVVIGGFTAPRGSRSHFGSLMVGVYEGKDLIYVGSVGTGFSESALKELTAQLKPLIQKTSPFREHPRPNAPATYVKPKLVAEVSFIEWTSEGYMRHPVFQGLRVDKKPRTIKREHGIEK